MHPDADAFLDAIFDAPDDDTPRLVYADWLQEHGQEAYAQFIRLQCAAAREKFWSDEANRLWEEIGRVWTRLDEEWWPATRDRWDTAHGNLDAVNFERGFLLSDIPVTGARLVRYAELWPWFPTPAMVLHVHDGCPLEALTHAPTLRRIRRVVVDRSEMRGLNALLASPHLCRVRNLTVGAIGPSQVDSLLTATNLDTVTDLNVWFEPKLWAVALPDRIPDTGKALDRLKSRFPRVTRGQS